MTAPDRADGPEFDEFAHVNPFQVHVSPSTAPDELYPPKRTSDVLPDPDTYANADSERAEGVTSGSCDAQSGPWNCVVGVLGVPSGPVTPPIVVVPAADGDVPPATGRFTVIGVPSLNAIVTDAARSDTDNAGPEAFTGPVGTPTGGGTSARLPAFAFAFAFAGRMRTAVA